MAGGPISTIEILCKRLKALEDLSPNLIFSAAAPADPPSDIDSRAEDDLFVLHQNTATGEIHAWNPSLSAWKAMPHKITVRPWQVIGDPENADTLTDVSGGVAAYRTGELVIGGADAAPARSAGPPMLEVIGKFASGNADHTVTGLKSAALGGSGNTTSGENAAICGGLDNQASNLNAFIGGGSLNVASALYSSVTGGTGNQATGAHSAIVGGFGNVADDFESGIFVGRNCTNSGQRAIVSGDTNINTGHTAAVFGSLNDNSGDATLVVGSLNTNASAVSIIAGTGNIITAAADGTIVAGFNHPNIAAARSIIVGDAIDASGGFGSLFCGASHSSGASKSIVVGESHTASGNNIAVFGSSNTVNTGARDVLAVGNSLVVNASVLQGFVGGLGAVLGHSNSFIFASNPGQSTIATASFTFQGAGGARFFTNGSGTVGAELTTGATAWSAISLRALKEEIVAVEGALDAIERIGIYEYSYKDTPSPKHRQIGPMADGEDGWAANVGTGKDDQVSSHDMAALALAGIKELIGQITELHERIDALEFRHA